LPSPEDENMPFPSGDFDTSSGLGEMLRNKWWVYARRDYLLLSAAIPIP